MHKSRLGCIVIDCQTENLDREAEFWASAFGHKVVRRQEPGDDPYRGLNTNDSQPKVLLQKVSHPSRVHLDIETDDIEQEVSRLKGLGAKEIERVNSWCVMEAPSGHRFCVVKQQRPDFDENATPWN